MKKDDYFFEDLIADIRYFAKISRGDCGNSNIDDIYVYVGSCIKKESYIYDCYPK